MLLLLTVALAGCQLRATFNVRIDRDGSGIAALTLGADEQLMAEAAAQGIDPLAEVAAAGEALREDGWQVGERAEPGQGSEVTLSRAFADAAELTALTAELSAALAGPELAPLESFALTVTRDELHLRGAASLELADAVSEIGLTADEAVALLRAEDAVDYRVRVTMPGEILDTDAAVQDGTQLEWVVPLGERIEIAAVSERPRAAVLRMVAGGLAGAALAGVVLALIARRRRARSMVVQRYRR